MTDLKQKLIELNTRRVQILMTMVAPARAAANQMKDAGMDAGAAPLLEVLFQYDAIEAEAHDLMKSDPEASFLALIELLGGDRQ